MSPSRSGGLLPRPPRYERAEIPSVVRLLRPDLRMASSRQAISTCAGKWRGIRHKKPAVFRCCAAGLTDDGTQCAADSRKGNGKKCGAMFTVCYNPEFMREGSRGYFLNPPYTILERAERKHLAPLRELYKTRRAGLYRNDHLQVAENGEVFSNSYHRAEVGFANEMGTSAASSAVETRMPSPNFTSIRS